MTSGWNLWVWLECIGVVSGWCCKEVPYSSKFSWHNIFVIFVINPSFTKFFPRKSPTKIIGCCVHVVGGASRKCSRNFNHGN